MLLSLLPVISILRLQLLERFLGLLLLLLDLCGKSIFLMIELFTKPGQFRVKILNLSLIVVNFGFKLSFDTIIIFTDPAKLLDIVFQRSPRLLLLRQLRLDVVQFILNAL